MGNNFFKRYKSSNSEDSTPLPTLNPTNGTPKERETSPGFLGLAKNLVTAMATWQRAGRPIVTSEQWNKRITICRGCPHWQEIRKSNIARCKKCGCSSGKLLLATSKCPLNPPKWREEPH